MLDASRSLERSRRRSARRRLVISAATIPTLAACISYRTTPSTAVSPGAEVRVTFAEGSAEELTRFFGPRAASIEGRVVGGSDSALAVAVSSVTRTSGVEESWPNDRIDLPRRAIGQLQTRRLSRGRSAVLAAAVVGTIAVLARAFRSSEDLSRGPQRPGGGAGQ